MIRDQLTSHAIVGETLAELIDHNEKDTYWKATNSRLFGRKKTGSFKARL